MGDTRQQIKSFIEQQITDEYNQQNSAARLKAALKYMTDNLSNQADDEAGGIRWINQPEAGTPVVENGLVSVPFSAGRGFFNGTTVPFEAYTQSGIVLAADTLQRLDAVVAFVDGSYGYVKGFDAANPVSPALPEGTLLVASILINDSGLETEVPDDGITVVNKVEQGNLNAVTSGAVEEELHGFIYKEYSSARIYRVGSRFKHGDMVYKVLAEINQQLLVNVPYTSYELAENLDGFPFIRDSIAANAITTIGVHLLYTNVGINLSSEAPVGQQITLTFPTSTSKRIPKGRKINLRIRLSAASPVIKVDANSRATGDLSVPTGAVSGDVILYQFFAEQDDVLTLVHKRIEGKESAGTGTTFNPTLLEAPSTVLNFTNQAGHERNLLVQNAALTFTLGAGPHKVFSTIVQPVQTNGTAINFETANFPEGLRYIAFDPAQGIPAGTYDFIFMYRSDGVSVSVPGYAGDYEPAFTPILADQYGPGKPAIQLNSQAAVNAYLLQTAGGTYTPPVASGPAVLNPSAGAVSTNAITLTWTNPA